MNLVLRLSYILPIILLSLCVTACDPTDSFTEIDTDTLVDYIPIQTEHDGYWGMMSVDGMILFESEFQNEPSLSINGMFSVKENGGYSLYTIDQQPKLVGDCEDLQHVGFYNYGLIPIVRKGGRISVVDRTGETKFTLNTHDGREIVSCAPAYYGGLLVVTNDIGLYGCIDVNGDYVIVPKYTYLSNFNENCAIARLKSGQYVVIDDKGETIFKLKAGFEVKSQYVVDGEFVIADKTGKLSFMNLKGDVKKLSSKVHNIGSFTRRLFSYADEQGNWGVMSREKDDVLIRPKFKSLAILAKGKEFLVNLADSWSIIDIKGKKVENYEDTYESIIYTDFQGLIKFFAKDDAGWMMFNERGKLISTDFDIYNLSLNTCPDGDELIESGFFNVNDFIAEITKLITPNSMAGITLNAIGNKAYDDQDPEEYDDRTEFTPSVLPESGPGYQIQVLGVTDKIIAQQRGNSYSFLPYNTINAIEVIVNTSSRDIFNKTQDAFVSILTKEGFRLIEQSEDLLLLRSIYANLEISPGEDGELVILMYRL